MQQFGFVCFASMAAMPLLLRQINRLHACVMTRRQLGGDGRRARIGIVVPSVNTVMEPWAQRTVPPGVSILAARMFIPPATTPEAFIAMDRNEGRMAIRQLSSVFPDVVAYGCTASSIVQGIDYDAHLRREISDMCKVPATTAAHSILSAARTLGAAAVSIVSPYTKDVDEAEHRYFEDAGLKVTGGACLGISDGFALAEPEPDALYELGVRGCDARAEALVMTCLNTRSHTVIARLEQALGKPVITSTQATLWHALRLAGIQDRIGGYGKLLAEF
jgi:maleate isomerase